MQSITIRSSEISVDTEINYPVLFVQLAGSSSDQTFEKYLNKIFDGLRISEIREQIPENLQDDFDRYVNRRDLFESAIQEALFFGVQINQGDRVETLTKDDRLLVLDRTFKRGTDFSFVIYRLSEFR